MNKYLIIILIALAFQKASAQNFIKSYNGSKSICGINGFKTDTINDKLYVYGNFLSTPCSLSDNYIACNQNGVWSFLGPFDHSISSVEIFNNELYACGWFSNSGGQPISSLAKYNGSSWVAVPGFTSAVNLWKLKVINNELYVCGGMINTQNGNFNGLAKFDGMTWSGFNVPNFSYLGSYVRDVALYNNELYIGGNFSISGGIDDDFVYYHNGQWQKPGSGIIGAMSGIEKLEVYKNMLFIGGLIYKGEGNVGNMLVAWNGNSMIAVGDGLKDNINTYGSAQVHDMMVFKSKLYIAGTFNYAGDIFSCGLTIFDGNTFCSLDKTPQLSVGLDALGQYHDTLYISGSLKYLNDSIMNIGRYWGNGTPDTCSVYYDVSVQDLNVESEVITIFPNPARDILTIYGETNLLYHSRIEIVNALGQVILNVPFEQQIDVSKFASGFYDLRIKKNNKKIIHAKFIKEN